MKQIIAVVLGAMLTTLVAGCAGMLTAPTITTSPPSLHGEKWAISGTEDFNPGVTKSYTTMILTVFINGNAAIKGPMNNRGATSLNATYEGHAIQAVCPLVGQYTQPYCQVYVDGTQAATLFFGIGSGPAPSSQGKQINK